MITNKKKLDRLLYEEKEYVFNERWDYGKREILLNIPIDNLIAWGLMRICK